VCKSEARLHHIKSNSILTLYLRYEIKPLNKLSNFILFFSRYFLRMLNSRLYQFQMIVQGELRRVNVIAVSSHEALKRARVVNVYDLNSYTLFRKKWFYLRKYIVKASYGEVFFALARTPMSCTNRSRSGL